MTTVEAKPVIFISYAHADEPENPRDGEVQWLSFVKKYIQAADPRRAVTIWVDRLMIGGDEIDPEIKRKLAECDVFALLVSPNSLTSKYVVKKEIAVIRARQKNGQDVRFYPLILTATPKSGLKIVSDKNLRPPDGKPLSSFPLNDRQQHMADAADEIVSIAKEIAARRKRSARSAPDSRNKNEEALPKDARREVAPPAAIAPSLGVATQATAAPPAPSPLPPNPKMIGRKKRLDELVEAIFDEERPIVVPGALGMGKTTLALAAAHDPRVIARFGKDRRFFVNLEPAPNAEGVVSRFAIDLGLSASGAASDLEANIAVACTAKPTLVILDNLETPWRTDTAATEALLGRLAAIEGLRLVITVRGEPPKLPAPGARALLDVEQLADADAHALFLRHAGDQFSADPALPGLLKALDGHPLSIELLAANAQGKADLKGLAADWSDRRADLLRHGAANDRKASLRASLDLSLAALNPPSPAHRLIRLMALLPDGMSETESRMILSHGEPTKEERGAAAGIETARLASRASGRWRLLAPIRETLLADFPPEAEDRARLVGVFLSRAALGVRAGRDQWNEVREELTAEAGNLDAMIGLAAGEPELPKDFSSAVTGLCELHRFTGLASCASLSAVAKRLHNAGDLPAEANCVKGLGDIAFDRSDHEGARQRFEAALPLYQKIGSVLGEANCVKGLGDIALARSDHDAARQRFEAALPLYQKVGDMLGEANCISNLGDIALARSDHDGARQRFEAALPLYQKIGSVLGEANCIKSLGDIDLARSDHDAARQRFEAALPLYQKVGGVLGEANCISRLGEIALARSDHDGARQRFEAALPLYQKIGSVLGEANCIISLGDIDLARSDHDAARQRFEAALPLYQKVGGVLGEANCISKLGEIALHHSDHEGARKRYEEALPLYQKRGDVLGEANCIKDLGDIALARSDYEGARQRFEAALPLYKMVSGVLGKANCISKLGEIALHHSDHEGARKRYEEALPLYQKIGDVLGEANCIKDLGDIALARSDYEGARQRYNAALPLYKMVGGALGEANCVSRLGEIALRRSDHEVARQLYEEALPLYQKNGSALGQANCTQSLGDIHEAAGEIALALKRWREALALYTSISEPYSIGFTRIRLARGAATPAEAAGHREAARKAWESIDRPDLIEEHFGREG